MKLKHVADRDNFYMTVFVANSNFYTVFFVYTAIIRIVAVGTLNVITVLHFSLIVLPGLLALFYIARVGQRVHNNAERITISLAQLLNQTIPGTAHYKVLRHMLRLSSSHTIRVVLLGTHPIGYTLLPTSIGIITTYLIFALQFKNIV